MATTPGVPLTGLTDTADLRTGTVLVPDATADGEPIAYDQAGWQLAGGTFTGDVTIEKNNPILEISDSAPADQRRFQLIPNLGILNIRSVTDAGAVIATPIKMGYAGDLDMTGATSVTVPAATAATHAAQVTAIDATTGRLAIGGIEIGDTGWRDVSANLANNWTVGAGAISNFRIRRTGYTVTLLLDALVGTAATSATFYNLTTGFRVGSATNPHLMGINDPYGARLPVGFVIAGGTPYSVTVLDATPTSLGRVEASLSFSTTDAWPSSLPGTPVAAAGQLPA